MKWIVVVLVLLNLAAWLLGKRIDPDALQGVDVDQVETINAAGMSVIEPAEEMVTRKVNEARALEEETLAQLMVDKRGKVLMSPTAIADAKKQAEESKPMVVSSSPPNIVALDRSRPVASNESAKKPATKPVELAKSPASKPDSQPETTAEKALQCFRLGPFTSQNSLAAVRRELENERIKYAVDERSAAGKVKGVRVYLGAFNSTATMQAEVKRLKGMGIDNYVIRLNGIPLVQLGYFSEPARAKAYQKTLKARGIEAKADTIYHEAKIDSWLDVKMASKKAIDALKLPGKARAKAQACR